MIKSVVTGIGLVVGSVILALAAFEVVLMFTGAYGELATQRLRPSPAIWERPRNAVEFHRHPDTGAPIRVVYDDDGVRNHGASATSEKKEIVGFFGDSFTENRRVEDRFAFTSILQGVVRKGVNVVNFGVDAYGIDQNYLRYKKFEDLDIQTVVYVFCENDLRNLYETNLTYMDDDGGVKFRTPEANRTLRLLGKLRISYLVLDAYYQGRAMVRRQFAGSMNFTDRLFRAADKFSGARRQQKKRLRDEYSESIVSDLLGPTPTVRTLELAKKFQAVLRRWRTEVEARGRRFEVLVLPRPDDAGMARRLIVPDLADAVYTSDAMADYGRYRFKNDVHWDERGNLKAAEIVFADPRFRRVVNPDQTGARGHFEKLGRDIRAYYKSAGISLDDR